MIGQLRLRGFKRFRDLTLPLAPLTVLTGMNGAGKSTVLQALMLARSAGAAQPVAMGSAGRFVELNGPFGLALGEAIDVINRATDREIGLTISASEDHEWRFCEDTERSLFLLVSLAPPSLPASLTSGGRRFTYLSADRLGPRDTLAADSIETQDLGVGARGEFVAQVLERLDRQGVAPGRHAPDSTTGLLRHQTEAWMSKIVRPIEIQAEWFPNSTVTRLRFKTPGARSDLTRPPNMGFGVSYALPIIVAALVAPPGGLLLLENPEAHLHPAGQSMIGRFLAQVAADGVQIIVETHSDHVINGIRRAIADPSAPLHPKDAIVHFFGGEGETDEPRSLEISALGGLSEWPAGFFDQIEQDLAALSQTRRARKP